MPARIERIAPAVVVFVHAPYNRAMSDTANESNIPRGGELVALPGELLAEFRRASGVRGALDRKIAEIIEDWIDVRNATRAVQRMKDGIDKPIPLKQFMEELGL